MFISSSESRVEEDTETPARYKPAAASALILKQLITEQLRPEKLWGCVYYRALVHFAHFAHLLSAFTLTKPAEFSALKVPGWRTRNGKKKQCKTMDTTRTKRAPSWLRSGRGGALSAAFHKKHVYFASVTSTKWLTLVFHLRQH